MTPALTIARRELAAYFHAPIAYVVGVLFLAVQGLSFWALVEVLADSTQSAPFGAVLTGYFGGNVLYWALLFLVVSALSMRLVAEEKMRGTWELMLTTRVEIRSVLVGKWLGAVAFYVVLWTPTLLYLLVLRWFSPPDVSFELGPVVSAYFGVLLGGSAFIAVGLAASAATANQIVAAVSTFVVLLILLIVGQLPTMAPTWLAEGSRFAATAHWIDLRDHMQRFASGAIDFGPVVFYLGLTAAALAWAVALAGAGRRRASTLQARAIAAVLVLVIVALGNVIAARHEHRWDVTARHVNSLDSITRGVLDSVRLPVKLLMIRPGEAAFEPLWQQVSLVIARMERRQPLVRIDMIDPAQQPARMSSLAREMDLSPKDLKDYGAVVVRAGERQRVVDLVDVAGFDRDALGKGELSQFRAEEAIATAIAEVTVSDRATVCVTSGHGELPVDNSDADSANWSGLAHRLEREAVVIEDVGSVSAGVPAYCRVLAVVGPRFPLAANEALAVADYLHGGGRLFVAASNDADPRADPLALPMTGLELVLESFGIALTQAIGVDPGDETAVPAMPGVFRVVDGYGEHPVSAAFRGRRFTVWTLPRVLLLTKPVGDVGADDAAALVSTSPAGWGETELAAVGASTAPDKRDIAGPVVIAAVGSNSKAGARVVVFGSALSLSSLVAGRGLGAADSLAASAMTWLAGRRRHVNVGDKRPEQLRLVMSPAERKGTFFVCVVLIPLLFAGAGAVGWRIRRRG